MECEQQAHLSLVHRRIEVFILRILFIAKLIVHSACLVHLSRYGFKLLATTLWKACVPHQNAVENICSGYRGWPAVGRLVSNHLRTYMNIVTI